MDPASSSRRRRRSAGDRTRGLRNEDDPRAYLRIDELPEVRLADGRYWHGERMQRMVDRRIQLLIPPDISRRRATRCSWDGGRYEQIREVLACDLGRELYIRSMTSQGSAYARFQRALKTGNLTLIRNAAAELPRVDLGDALAVCIAIRQAEPDRFERAALRWLARFCLERREATLAQVQAAAWAFDNITDEPAALDTLQRLCSH